MARVRECLPGQVLAGPPSAGRAARDIPLRWAGTGLPRRAQGKLP